MSFSDFSPFMQSKRCDKCDWDKGIMAFERGSNRCKRCIVEDIVDAHKQGIKTMRKCTKCEKEKDAVPNFYIRPNDNLFASECKLCKRQEQTKRLYGDIIEVRCIKRFTFNYHKICDKCEVIKHEKEFGHSNNILCNGCRIQGRKQEYNGGRKKSPLRKLVNGEMECSKCKMYKPLNKYDVSKTNITTHGRKGICKKCNSESLKARNRTKADFIAKFNSMKEEMFT